jgi:peptidoglycan/xylan/chitin deacetylase (PgdA/CDA1 family)
MEIASDTGNIVMRKTTVLAAASAVVGSVIVIGFTLGLTRMVQYPAVTAAPSNVAEPELVTGATGSQSISSSSSLSRRPAAFAAPTDSVRASADASPSAAPPNLSCKNPDALGVARVVEIDTAGGPGFGSEHFKQHDFLRDKEVVLTFDDGPWPTTKAVLKALAEECVRATFFAIGKHATYYPEILRSVAEAGHSVGSHTWSHEDLSKKSPDEAKDEIERAISAVQWALGDRAQEASFFRFPALRHPPEMVTYLGERNVAIFSTDMDSFDFKLRKPEKIVGSIMTKLQKHGKGIVLMHDFQTGTSHALPQLLAELKAGGYKVVHVKSRAAVTTLRQYDEELQRDQKLSTVSQRPTSSIVRDVQ